MTSIPRAASLALWLGAWMRGAASPDDVLASLDPDVRHVFIGLDPERPITPLEALGAIRLLNTDVALALAAPGDPAGLAGPPDFNSAAVDAGEALLLPQAQLGIIPVTVGGAVEWRCLAANAPVPLDPREARLTLRTTLREVTDELVDLQITSWSNEIPDLLLERRDPVRTPAGTSAPDIEALSSAALCLDIVEASRQISPGALTASEWSRFEEALRRLGSAARRTWVAVCGNSSDSLTSP